MPDHVGHPTKAEESLQEIADGPSVEIERHVELIFTIAADSKVDADELIALLCSAGKIAIRNGRVRLMAAEGGAKVRPVV